jgi:hypothetical protein
MKTDPLNKALLILARNGDGKIWKVDPESGAVLSPFQGPANNAAGYRAGSPRLVHMTGIKERR